ncbi:hypothetical protein THASP1DRAFT_15940, partial [Thamnocephalis sphaerospora]
GWRSYRDYIGARILQAGYARAIKEQVLKSDRVKNTIKYLASRQAIQLRAQPSVSKVVEREDQLERELEVVVRNMADKMFADFSSLRTVRVFAFALSNILVRLYHQGIHIKESELLELRRHAIKAQQNKQSLIVLPCHKSHVDYLLISYVFFRLGLALPHIAAGDNLDLPVVGGILRRGGAFFIRRTWGDDMLYGELAREYIEARYNIECFIEGTRSRTGKLLQPKFGILKLILEGLLNGRTKDCIIVPMSIGYDRVIETETYASELLGQPKERESLWGVFNSTKLLQFKWGRVDVRFAKPFSLLEYCKDSIESMLTLRYFLLSPFNLENVQDKNILLRSLGYRQVQSVFKCHVAMKRTNALGTVILTLRGRGVGRSELVRRVNWLRREILRKGGRVAHFGGMSTGDIVDRAIQVMRDLVGARKEKDILEPVFYAQKRFELSFYRNQVIHLFLSEAIVSASMYVQIKIGGVKSAQRIPRSVLLDNASFISQLLKGEFIYRPGSVEDNMNTTLQSMERLNVVTTEDDLVGLSDVERKLGRENYATAQLDESSPTRIHPPVGVVVANDGVAWVEERVFLKKAQTLGKTLYYQGDISYMEAVNQETLKNAFSRLQTQGVMLYRRAEREPPHVALHPEFVPARSADGGILPAGKLWALVKRIGKFRREGKNRRDNATGERAFAQEYMCFRPLKGRYGHCSKHARFASGRDNRHVRMDWTCRQEQRGTEQGGCGPQRAVCSGQAIARHTY